MFSLYSHVWRYVINQHVDHNITSLHQKALICKRFELIPLLPKLHYVLNIFFKLNYTAGYNGLLYLKKLRNLSLIISYLFF